VDVLPVEPVALSAAEKAVPAPVGALDFRLMVVMCA
jgi:hypothetical protein